MERFISCDWGTSALRLKLVNAATGAVLAETTDNRGIADTFRNWKESGDKERIPFYYAVLKKRIDELTEPSDISYEDIPLIISGMASSSIGMEELPYKDIPFSGDGSDLNTRFIKKNNQIEHNILLISGAKTKEDVMRGEETQLAGCFSNNCCSDGLYVLPGTHSKHITVMDGMITGVKTFMTGEFFALLSEKSILSNAISKEGIEVNRDAMAAFEKGVEETKTKRSGILHNAFLVRTNALFSKMSGEENYFYLSGLLIGAELKDTNETNLPISIIADGQLGELYVAAFKIFGKLDIAEYDAGETIVKGHRKFYEHACLAKNKFSSSIV